MNLEKLHLIATSNNDFLDNYIDTHEPDYEMIKKWIESHKGEYKKMATIVAENIIYIPSKEVKDILDKLADEIKNEYSDKKLYLFFKPEYENMIQKSNFPFTLSLYRRLLKKGVAIAGVISDIHIKLPENSLIIFSDDVSYSGSQIVELFNFQPPKTPVFLALIAISYSALKRLKNIIVSNHTRKFSSIASKLNEASFSENFIEEYTEDEENHLFLDTSEHEEGGYQMAKGALYLDFKMPDLFSGIGDILLYGNTLDGTNVVGQLIKGDIKMIQRAFYKDIVYNNEKIKLFII